MKRIIITSAFLLLASIGFSQQTSVWHFGRTQAANPGQKNTGVTLDFSTSPLGVGCNSSIDTEEGSTSVGGGGNSTLFYSDGITVYDQDDNIMPNGMGLNGDPSSSQSGVAVPLPGNANQYYLFTIGKLGGPVSYSIVDMSLNGGKGDISSKNQSIAGITNSSEKITVIPRTGVNSYWIIIPTALESAKLNIYELTASGLSGVKSSITLPTGVNTQGYMKANQQSTQVAVSTKSAGQYATFDFDAATGIASNASTHNLPGGNNKVYGLEFSPSGSNLFISTLRGAYVGKLYKAKTNDLDNTMVQIYQAPSQFTSTGALQLGPNGKIYFAHSADGGLPGNKLAEISDPDNYNNPQYNHEKITFPCAKVFLGLPSFIPAFAPTCEAPASASITASNTDFCDGSNITLTANQVAGYSYFWTNAAGDTIDSGIDKYTTQINQSGTYKVIIADSKDLSDAGCALTSNTVTVTKRNNPTLTGSIDGKSPVCDGDSPIKYTLNDPNNANYSNINWLTLNNGATYTSNPSGNTEATISFANITNTANNVILKVYTEQTFGTVVCKSDTLTKTIVVDANPSVTLATNSKKVVCGSNNNEVVISNFNSTSSYALTVSPNTISATVTGNKIVFDVNQETGGSIEIIETTQNGCKSQKATLTIDVDGCGIDADFNVSTTASCSQDTITLSSNSTAGENATITKYEWTLPNELTLLSANADNSIIKVIGTNTTSSPIQVTVSHKITSSLGLTDTETKTSVITLNPLPKALTIVQLGKICVGEQERFTVNPLNTNSDYLWHTSLNTQDVTRDTFNVTNTESNYTVFVREKDVNGCFSPEASKLIQPEKDPVLTLNVTKQNAACESTNNTITINNYDAASTYTITSNNTSITTSRTGNTISYNVGKTDGKITVSQTSANGCKSNDATVDITVIGCGLKADVSIDNAIVCSNDTITLTSTSNSGNSTTITAYDWTLPSELVAIGNTNQATIKVKATNTTSSPIKVDVSLKVTSSAGLTDDTTLVQAVTINPLPNNITIQRTKKICVGEDAVFKVNPFNNSSSYTWYTSDNNTKKTIDSLVVTNPTNDYTVFVQESNQYSCLGAESSLLVQPEKDPVLTLSTDKQTVACNSTGNSFTINNYDASATYKITTNEPTISITRTGNTVSYDVTKNAGTISITQTSPNDCESNVASVVITVNGCGLNADFTIDKDTVCSGETITLTSTSDPGASATITAYKWTLPAELTAIGSTTSATLVAKATSTISKRVDVSLEITTSANLTSSKTINVLTINPLPTAISINTFGTICSADSAQFSVSPKTNTSTYNWTSTTGNIVTNLNDSIVTTNGNIDYTISVIETTNKGCTGDTAKTTVTIGTNPTLSLTDTITVSCNSSKNLSLINPYDNNSVYSVQQTTSGITANISNDSLLFNVGSTNGTITVLQTTANQCTSNTETIVVDIIGCGFQATFDIDDAEVCSGDTVTLFSTSDAGKGATITQYNWTLPNGLTSLNGTDKDSITVVTTSTTIDTMIVGLKVTTSANLTDSTTKKVVRVNPLPKTININKFGTICSSDEAQFSVDPKTLNSQYAWSSTNNKIIDQLNVIGIKDSVVVQNGDTDYTISVIETDSNGCIGTEAKLDITVEINPTLAFKDSITVSCNSTKNLVLINQYDAASSYSVVDSTNGLSASIFADSIFINAGSQNGKISIQQTSNNQCKSNVKDVFITVIGCGLEANFTFTDSICSKETVTLDGTSSKAGANAIITKYNWTLPNSMTIVSANADSSIIDVLVNNQSDTLLANTVNLNIITDANLSDDTTKQNIVIIKPLPNQPTITQQGKSCPGDTALFIAGNTNNHNLIWSSTVNPYVTPTDTAIYINGTSDYTVNLTLENQYGCRGNSASSLKKLGTLPSNIKGIFGAQIGCPIVTDINNKNYTYQYIISADNATFEWSTSNGISISDNTNDTINIKFPYNGDRETFTLNVDIKGSGCASKETRSLDVTIDTLFALDVTLSNNIVCIDDSSQVKLSFGPNSFPNQYLKNISIDWMYNTDSLHSNRDSLDYTVKKVQLNDSVRVKVNTNLCVISGSTLEDKILLNGEIRPGGDLLIDGVKDAYQNEILKPADVILTDAQYPGRILTSANASDSIYQFYWVKDNGQKMNDTIVLKFPENVELTPPNCDKQKYDVTYFMITGNGTCFDTSTAVLHLSYDFFIPNAFTPNNDGEFDTWEIENLEKYSPVQVEIYNRWGNLVYDNNNYDNSWDGVNNNGEKLPFGTYFYIVDFKVEGVKTRHGSVSIIK